MQAASRVLLFFHLGLGDMLVSNALIRYMCSHHEDVVVIVKKPYMQSALFLWKDVDNLSLYPVTGQRDTVPLDVFTSLGFTCVVLGDNGITPWRKSLDWTKDLYAQAGVPTNIIRRGFILHRDRDREQATYDRMLAGHDGPYVFVHDDPLRGYTIDSSRLPRHKVIHPGRVEDENPSTCLFDYCRVIERAEEVHVIDSSYSWLVELVGLHTNCTMHCYVKSGEAACRAVFRGPWNFITDR